MHHMGESGRPPRKVKGDPYKIARSGPKGQCRNVEIPCQRNSVLGIYIHNRWYTATTKKVQAILALTPPTGVKDLHRFLGMVQYYRDLWAKQSDMLAPLTSLVGECGHTKVIKALKTKKVPWHWGKVHQKSFNDIKTIIARDLALAYPDYSKEFEIYTDSSSRQMDAVITQRIGPLCFSAGNCQKCNTNTV